MNAVTTISPNTTLEILAKGMDCLVKHLGVIEAESFIAAVKRERFDYTEWQRTAFDNYTLDSFLDAAVKKVDAMQ